jgi:hypothetical protein
MGLGPCIGSSGLGMLLQVEETWTVPSHTVLPLNISLTGSAPISTALLHRVDVGFRGLCSTAPVVLQSQRELYCLQDAFQKLEAGLYPERDDAMLKVERINSISEAARYCRCDERWSRIGEPGAELSRILPVTSRPHAAGQTWARRLWMFVATFSQKPGSPGLSRLTADIRR